MDLDLGRTPSEDSLTVEHSITCPVDGCNKQFKSSSCLLMHKLRRHERKKLEKINKEGKTAYFCPEESCERSEKNGSKPFPRLGQLKQHYQTVHASKNYKCEKCGRKFGLRDVFKRHLAECGQVFICQSCGDDFHSKNALYQHCKRKGHGTSSLLKRKTNPKEALVRPVILAPIFVLPIPVSPMADSGPTSSQQQQQMQCVTSPSPVITMQTKDDTSSVTKTASDLFNSSTSSLLLNTDCPSASYDLAIQTDALHSYSIEAENKQLIGMTSPINQGVQTKAVDYNELGTQTIDAFDYNYFSSSVICDEQSLADAHLHLTDATSSMNLSLLPPDCSELGTQTMESAFDDISCLDFGVQTLLPTETRDQGSQTLSNLRANIV